MASGPFRGLRTWANAHPWLTTLAFIMVGSLIIWLLPPRPDLGATIVRTTLTIGAILALNFLIYRRFFPTPQQRHDEDERVAEIDAAVRRQRELDSRL